MRRLNSRERLLASITATVVGLAVGYHWLLEPQLDRQAELEREVGQLQISLTRMQANLLLKDKIERQYEELKNLVRHSGSSSQEMARFARLLSEICSPLGMTTKSVRPLPDVNAGFYRKFMLQVEMSGSLADIADFLAAVNRVQEPIRIERMQLTCQDRPDLLAASIVVTRVVTTEEPNRLAGKIVASGD